MAEDPDQIQPSLQAKLVARLRLQRLLFGVLAAVLVTGAALGLSAFRRMQWSLSQAEREAESARADTLAAAARSRDLEQQKEQARQESDAISRALGLASARMAVQESRAGAQDRARELLQDSQRYGAPPWWPLAAHGARETTVRFRGSLHPDAPIACGQVTPDGTRLIVARNVPGACVLELYDAQDGALVASGSPPLAADRAPPLAEALALAADGRRFVLAAQGRLFAGEAAQDSLRFVDINAPGARVTHLGSRPDLSATLVCRGTDGLFLLQSGAAWTLRTVPVPRGEARAACFGGPGEVYLADSANLYRAREDGPFLPLCELGLEPESVRIGIAGGGIAVAARTPTELEHFILEVPGDRVRMRARHELTGRADGTLQMLADGTVMTGVGAGRALEFRPGRSLERALGGIGLSFAAWHPLGLLFGNAQGELGLRAISGDPGVSVAALAPQLEAAAQPFGFVTVSPDGDRAAWLPSAPLVPLPGASRVWLAGQRIAYTVGDNSLWLDREGVIPGKLLGAGEGGLLLWRETGLWVERSGAAGQALAGGTTAAPDEVCVSANFAAAVLRRQDSLFYTDLRGDPLPIGRRGDSSTDLFSLSADGRHLALVSGAAATVRPAAGGPERALLLESPPRCVALLFDGTVLACALSGALVLYEVQGGRELARFAGAVSSMAATPQNDLLLVCNGVLRKLAFAAR